MARVDKKDTSLKMVLLVFFLFINDETNNINNKYHNIDNQKDSKYCLRVLQHRYSRPINCTYSGYNANNTKGGIIMKKADVHVIVAMLATLVSMFTVMAMMFMRFFG